MRQKQILRRGELIRFAILLFSSEGWNLKSISELMGVSLKTIHYHCSLIYRLLEVQSITHAVAVWIRNPRAL